MRVTWCHDRNPLEPGTNTYENEDAIAHVLPPGVGVRPRSGGRATPRATIEGALFV